ncbi:coiled-coil domain-containing protein 38-like isoform X2 [Heterodontus francisci]|uniref:coiled-coil domain-containing protein 38-like isoform X2 n=1 Tax=Heterodontus francisci TaxID=7792 RepID=UPI00355B4EBF
MCCCNPGEIMAMGAVTKLPSIARASGPGDGFLCYCNPGETMTAGAVTKLPSPARASGAVIRFSDEDEKHRLTNPLTITANAIEIREKLQQLQRKGTISAQGVPGYSKSTHASRKKAYSSSLRRLVLEYEAEEEDENEDFPSRCFTIGGASSDKYGVKDYIRQQRQLFLMQYTLGVKEKSIAALEQTAHEKQQQLIDDEKQLLQNKIAVEDLMTESQSRRTKAMQRSIANLKQDLNDCFAAKKLFDQLAPKEWKEKHQKEKIVPKRINIKAEAFSSNPFPPVIKKDHRSRKSSTSKAKRAHLISKRTAPRPVVSWMEKKNELDAEEEANEINVDDNPLDSELYFKDPQQILDIFSMLEEQIVSLLQYNRETEEDIDRVDQRFTTAQETMMFNIHCLKKQVEQYEDAIAKVDSATKDVEFMTKMFSWGETTGESEKEVLELLDLSLTRLHQMCFRDAKVPENALQKMSSVEREIHRLLDSIDMIATEKTVSAILKRKQKENRDSWVESWCSVHNPPKIKMKRKESWQHRKNWRRTMMKGWVESWCSVHNPPKIKMKRKESWQHRKNRRRTMMKGSFSLKS